VTRRLVCAFLGHAWTRSDWTGLAMSFSPNPDGGLWSCVRCGHYGGFLMYRPQ
jgi:hypothetical protein